MFAYLKHFSILSLHRRAYIEHSLQVIEEHPFDHGFS
jgi:hypothetical protein